MDDQYLAHLLPVKEFLVGFTTSKYLVHPNLTQVALKDEELGVHKVSAKTTHQTVCPPSQPSNIISSDDEHIHAHKPSLAWEAFYPKGSINPAAAIPGGFGFYLAGPPTFAKELKKATEAVFSYRIMLQEGWDWVKGGKLPGVCGLHSSVIHSCGY